MKIRARSFGVDLSNTYAATDDRIAYKVFLFLSSFSVGVAFFFSRSFPDPMIRNPVVEAHRLLALFSFSRGPPCLALCWPPSVPTVWIRSTWLPAYALLPRLCATDSFRDAYLSKSWATGTRLTPKRGKKCPSIFRLFLYR